jgi:hypothetical protein
MSINVLIGADPEDLTRITNLIAALKFLRETLPDKTSVLDLEDGTFNLNTLEDLIDWFESMKNIINYVGNEEDTLVQS